MFTEDTLHMPVSQSEFHFLLHGTIVGSVVSGVDACQIDRYLFLLGLTKEHGCQKDEHRQHDDHDDHVAGGQQTSRYSAERAFQIRNQRICGDQREDQTYDDGQDCQRDVDEDL